MSSRRYATWGVEVLLVVLLISTIGGAVLGQPILLGFVESGSMEPTLDAGDGFVAIPSPVAGEVQEGDVVVFEAQNLHGGGLTTHRVVDETDTGYVTRGDANAFTDQDNDEPPVTDGQIVAKALQVNGRVIVIPGLGALVGAIQGGLDAVQRTVASTVGSDAILGVEVYALLIAGAGLVVLAFGFLFDEEQRSRSIDRERSREEAYDPRRLVVAMALFVAVVSCGTMVAMSTTHEFDMVSASFDSGNPTTVPVGEASNVTYAAHNGGQLPVYAFYSPASGNVDVEPSVVALDRGASEDINVTLQAPPETGYYPQYVTEHRYFVVLPFPALAVLYDLHPWLPTVATGLVMGAPFLVGGLLVLGSSPSKLRSRSRRSRS